MTDTFQNIGIIKKHIIESAKIETFLGEFVRQVLQVRLACSVLIVSGCIMPTPSSNCLWSGQQSGSDKHFPIFASSILLVSLYKKKNPNVFVSSILLKILLKF